jgi:hypothetical protein
MPVVVVVLLMLPAAAACCCCYCLLLLMLMLLMMRCFAAVLPALLHMVRVLGPSRTGRRRSLFLARTRLRTTARSI